MAVTAPVRVVEDPRFRDHVAPRGHPENSERLTAVTRALARFGDRIARSPARPANPRDVLRVHGRAHVALLEDAVLQAPARIDADTYVSSQSLDVAMLAVGSTVDLSRSVARGEVRYGIAAIRPPGHHAESDRAMGFCLLNNVAIAVRALQREDQVGRVLVFDWDVHHGNGTQHFFEEDPSVFYVSTHQFPYYPGTGAAEETGRGRGAGATLNIPMPAGCGDEEYVGALLRLLVPAARHFAPDLILVSCGFDAHRDDPLASMNVSAAGFLAMTRIVRALADDLCEGRLAFALEGGYAASGLDEGTTALVDGLLEPTPALPEAPPLLPGSTLRGIVERVTAVHGARIPGLGAV